MKNNYKKIKKLMLQIATLEKELNGEKAKVLDYLKNTKQNKIAESGLIINYFPASTYFSVDTEKLKKDNLYNKYSKEVNKKEYIKIEIKEVI